MTSRKKSSRRERVFVAEWNRVAGGTLSRRICSIEREGIKVERIPHLTAIKLRPPLSMSFEDLRIVLTAQLQPGRGSVLLHSAKTGNTYVGVRRRRRSGHFIRIN